jgi:hypothetical protein
MSRIATTTPIVVTLVFAVIAWAASKARHETSSGDEIYKYPPVTGWLMLACGSFFLSIPFLGGRGDVPPLFFFWFFAVFAALAFAAVVYFFRYRVIVGVDAMKFGALRFESVPLADVVDTEVTAGRTENCWCISQAGDSWNSPTCWETSPTWRTPWTVDEPTTRREPARASRSLKISAAERRLCDGSIGWSELQSWLVELSGSWCGYGH